MSQLIGSLDNLTSEQPVRNSVTPVIASFGNQRSAQKQMILKLQTNNGCAGPIILRSPISNGSSNLMGRCPVGSVDPEQIDVISEKMRSIASSNLKAILPEVG